MAGSWTKGPLPKLLGKIPINHAASILIADLSPGGPHFTSATATLIQLGKKKILITCSHVIEKYRELWVAERRSLFQVGALRFEPTHQLIAEDKALDLATIELTESQARSLTEDGGMKREFFLPVVWPPPPVSDQDWLALGGYPGVWRARIGFNVIEFKSYSLGSTAVTSVSECSIGCQFARERWVSSDSMEDLPELNEAGMSGGPAFAVRTLNWDFAGIIYEFSPTFDIMFLRPAQLIGEDGSITPHP